MDFLIQNRKNLNVAMNFCLIGDLQYSNATEKNGRVAIIVYLVPHLSFPLIMT